MTSGSFSLWLTYHANRLTTPRVQDCRRGIICRDDFQKARAANNTEYFALFVFGFAVISAKGSYLATTNDQPDPTEIVTQDFASEVRDAVAEAINVNDARLDLSIA